MKKQIVIYLLILFVLISCQTPAEIEPEKNQPSYMDPLVNGLDQWEKDKRVPYFEQALDRSPGNPLILYLMGKEEKHAGNIKEALKYFEEAQKADPNFAMAFYMAGTIKLWELGDESGIEELKKAYDLYPESFDISMTWIELMDDKKTALIDLAERFPDRWEPVKYLALDYFSKGDLKNALLTIDKAISLFPEIGLLYIEKGHFLISNGEKEAALEAYRLGINLEPENPYFRGILGNFYLAQGEMENAERELLISLQSDWVDWETYLGLTKLYSLQGDREKAMHYLSFLEEKGAYFDFLEGVVLFRTGDMEEGIKKISRANKEEKWNLDFQLTLAAAYVLMGERDKGELILDMMEDKDVSDAPWYSGFEFQIDLIKKGLYSPLFDEFTP